MAVIRLVVAVVMMTLVNCASAQGAVTALAVKSALEGAIAEFRKALAEATNDIQSIGNSLQANAQNVILDMDRTIGKNINLTFDHLNQTELRLAEDAQALTRQIQLATTAVVQKAGDEARRTIVEADIAAYNTSYSLPCRDAIPRIVASFPAVLINQKDSPVMLLRGNFLRQGGELTATVNGIRSPVLERLDTSLKVGIPPTVLASVIAAEVNAVVQVNGLIGTERTLWAWGLFGCHESSKPVTASALALTILQPPYHYELTGDVHWDYMASRNVAEPAQQADHTGSNQCDDDFRVDTQYCVTSGTLATALVRVTSQNCSSGYQGWVPSGDRCILVRGNVAGCGANRGPFNTWLGCRGRGWLHWNVQLTHKEEFGASTAPVAFNKVADPATWSFTLNMPDATGLALPQARYNVVATLRQGVKVVASYAVSHANPNAGPITSRVNGGLLAVEASAP